MSTRKKETFQKGSFGGNRSHLFSTIWAQNLVVLKGFPYHLPSIQPLENAFRESEAFVLAGCDWLGFGLHALQKIACYAYRRR